MRIEDGRVAAPPGSHPSGHAGCAVDGASRFDPSRVIKLGLPWPWRFRKIAIRGDTCFFWAYSRRTFAVGFEDLQDGFIVFLGCFCIGWGSISAAMDREPEYYTRADVDALYEKLRGVKFCDSDEAA